MEILTYPTALVFAALMAIILVSPIIFTSSIIFTKWLNWTTSGKVTYYDPIHKWYRKYLAINDELYTGEVVTHEYRGDKKVYIRSAANKMNIEFIYPGLSIVFTLFVLGRTWHMSAIEHIAVADTLSRLFFGVWIDIGLFLAAPIFVIGTFLVVSYGAKYSFTLYDKVVSRLKEVESKSHTHND